MVRFALLVLLLGGCDALFNLDPVRPLPEDGRTPDSDSGIVVADAPIDAKPCTPINHNEDGDSLDDGCDSCPTVTNVGVDGDGDGLDNACDPNLGTNQRDQILFWTTFPTSTTLTADFTSSSGAMWEAGTNGQVVVQANAVLTARDGYKPTKIAVHTAQVGVGIGAEANVMHSGATCQVIGSDCNKTTTLLSCVNAYPNGGSGNLSKPSSDIRLIEMIGPGAVKCAISSPGTSEASAGTSAMLSTNNLQFTTNSSGALIITAIVIYGTL